MNKKILNLGPPLTLVACVAIAAALSNYSDFSVKPAHPDLLVKQTVKANSAFIDEKAPTLMGDRFLSTKAIEETLVVSLRLKYSEAPSKGVHMAQWVQVEHTNTCRELGGLFKQHKRQPSNLLIGYQDEQGKAWPFRYKCLYRNSTSRPSIHTKSSVLRKP